MAGYVLKHCCKFINKTDMQHCFKKYFLRSGLSCGLLRYQAAGLFIFLRLA